MTILKLQFALLASFLILSGCASTLPETESVLIGFNDPLNLSGEPSANNRLFEEIVNLVQSARKSLDIAVYHIQNLQIIEALNAACQRGAAVRIVTELSSHLSSRLAPCVQALDEKNDRLMHHKFMIVDQEILWTGSANWTDSSLFDDFNNDVIFHSSKIAAIFASEFEEMFEHDRFGRKKSDQNQEKIQMGSEEIEIYFSPSDRPKSRVVELIEKARSSIQLAVYAFTDNDLFAALKEAHRRGVQIDALWDFQSGENCQFSEADELSKIGIGNYEAGPGLLHHKFAVIDSQITITGSANWSDSGFEHNDEAVIIFQSSSVAKKFQIEFERIKADADRFSQDHTAPPRLEARTFSAPPHAALILWKAHDPGAVQGYEICRTDFVDQQNCDKIELLPPWAWYYLDTDVTPGQRYFYRMHNIFGEQSLEFSNQVEIEVSGQNLPSLTAEEAEHNLKQYKSRDMIVRYQISESFLSDEGNLFLNSGQDYRTDFSVFIPACAFERFNGSGLDLFALGEKWIEVVGELQEFNGPEIVITSPWQIRLLNQ